MSGVEINGEESLFCDKTGFFCISAEFLDLFSRGLL